MRCRSHGTQAERADAKTGAAERDVFIQFHRDPPGKLSDAPGRAWVSAAAAIEGRKGPGKETLHFFSIRRARNCGFAGDFADSNSRISRLEKRGRGELGRGTRGRAAGEAKRVTDIMRTY